MLMLKLDDDLKGSVRKYYIETRDSLMMRDQFESFQENISEKKKISVSTDVFKLLL